MNFFGKKLGLLTATVAVLAIAGTSCTTKTKEVPNTLHRSSLAKIKGLDPILADDLYAADEVARPYEGLLQYHYLKRPYVLAPSLAEAMPEVSADGKTLTFRLKKGVLFQDDPAFKATNGKGRELTAEDVVYSFKRLADPKLNSTGWWLFDGKIVGLNEWHDAAAKTGGGADYAAPVAGLKVIDRYTLQIQLVQRSGQFMFSLAMPFTFIVAREAVETYGKEFLNHPVGTGPFKLEEFNPSSRLIWVKNPTYRLETYPSEGEPTDQANGFMADAGKPLPLVDRLVVDIIVEDQPRWLNFLAGKLDVAGIPKDNYDQSVTPQKELTPDLKAKGMVLIKSPTLDVTHQSFNMADPIMGKNKLLRQAISLAINPETPISLFYNNRAIPSQGPIPPGLAGYDPNLKNPYRQFNIEKAKELLAKAGYPGGKGLAPIEYITTSSTTTRQMDEYLQKELAAIGVQLKLDVYSWPEFTASIKNKKGQMWGFAWTADYPDAENFLQMFYGKNVSPGPNDANYVNPEFDKLYEKALVMNDSPERTALYQQMVKIVIEDCPWVFGVHRESMSVIQPWIRNYKFIEFTHGRDKYLRVDATAKK